MNKILSVSIGGVSSTDVHELVETILQENLEPLGYNYIRGQGDAMCSRSSIDRLHSQVFNYCNGCNRMYLVGKSAGGILIYWYIVNYHNTLFRYFNKISIVTIDPHGAILGDGKIGTYHNGSTMCFPLRHKSVLIVTNVRQDNNGLTGAKLIINYDSYFNDYIITDKKINHSNIVKHQFTKSICRESLLCLKDQ